MLAESGLHSMPTMLFAIDTLDLNFSSIEEALTLRLPTVAFISPSHLYKPYLSIYPIIGTTTSFSQGLFSNLIGFINFELQVYF